MAIESPRKSDPDALSREHIRRMVEQLEPPALKLLEIMRPEIDATAYRIVIGEDASGRIPALVIGGALHDIYHARGAEPPFRGFVAGSKGQHYDAAERKIDLIAEHISDAKERYVPETTRWEAPNDGTWSWSIRQLLKKTGLLETHGKALVVTENITSGTSIKPIVEAFRQNGISVDVATLFHDSEEVGIGTLQDMLGAKVYDAGAWDGEFELFRHKKLSGVMKDPTQLFARRMEDLSPEERLQLQEAHRAASESAKRIAIAYLQNEGSS